MAAKSTSTHTHTHTHGLLIAEFPRSQSDTPHSVGLLWTNDQLVAETSIWQHKTLRRNRQLCPRQDLNPQYALASDPIRTP